MFRSGSRKGTSVKPTGENDKNKKIEELKQEFAERAMQIPEEPNHTDIWMGAEVLFMI